MLCSNCYKKIPEGEEVAKTSGYWKINGWGRYGNEIYCKKCAIRQEQKNLIFITVFISILLFCFTLGIVIVKNS